MLRKMRRSELQNKYDIWNAMIETMCEYDFPPENKRANEVFLVYDYYSETQSGGHEGLLNWSSWYIEEMGVSNYFTELIRMLREINAHEYAAIEEKYGEKMWELHKLLENGDILEGEYYAIIEKANTEYEELNGKIGDVLEAYFVNIYQEFIEVVDD